MGEVNRVGMYKNFRVGLVKFYEFGKDGAPDHLVVKCIEMCYGDSGVYFSTYLLYIEINKSFAKDLSLSSIGRWVLIGFYIQSFFGTTGNVTTLKLRHYEELSSDEDVRVEISTKTKTREIHESHQIPKSAFDHMERITKQTSKL